MCGIIGYIGNTTTEAALLFRNLLIMDQRRGRDSTGLLSLTQADSRFRFRLLKSPLAAKAFFLKEGMEEKVINCVRDSHLLLGHNRAATRGKIDAQRAQPIVASTRNRKVRLGLVHNGKFSELFVSAAAKVLKEDEEWFSREIGRTTDASDTEIFSYYLARLFEESGDALESLKQALKAAEENESTFFPTTAYAVMCIMVRPGIPARGPLDFFIVRNVKRPAVYYAVPEGPLKGTWVVSEKEIFEDALLPLMGTGGITAAYIDRVLKDGGIAVEPHKIFRIQPDPEEPLKLEADIPKKKLVSEQEKRTEVPSWGVFWESQQDWPAYGTPYDYRGGSSRDRSRARKNRKKKRRKQEEVVSTPLPSPDQG